MDRESAQRFAEAWVAAWNAHDLDRILAHYEDDFEMTSPVIRQLVGERTGSLRGKAAARAYWAKAIAATPNLRFELLNVFVGVDSLVVHYAGHRGLSAELFQFASSGKVSRAMAHYADWPK